MSIARLLGYQPTLYVDDGHGYDPATGQATPGKRTPPMPDTNKPIYENQFNSAVAKKFGELAVPLGFRIVYIAPEATDTSLKIRCSRANTDFQVQQNKYPKAPAHKLGLLISFHYNAFNGVFDNKKGGVETLYHSSSAEGKRLAQLVQEELVKGTPQVNRGIVPRNDLYILNATKMVAIIIEAGFMDKLEEAKLMLKPEFHTEVATETLRGVCRYYGYAMEKLIAPQPTPTTGTSSQPNAPEWKLKGLRWMQGPPLNIDSKWKVTDIPDMGTLGTILERLYNNLKGNK